MEQNKETPQQPNSNPADTEIHSLLDELIQKDASLAGKEKKSLSPKPAEKTPLANLKTMLSAADSAARDGKNISTSENVQLVPEDTAPFQEEKNDLPGLSESEAVRRLSALIKAHRSQRKP